jgi:hypothetical protein
VKSITLVLFGFFAFSLSAHGEAPKDGIEVDPLDMVSRTVDESAETAGNVGCLVY